jgi:hypothetical protein
MNMNRGKNKKRKTGEIKSISDEATLNSFIGN